MNNYYRHSGKIPVVPALGALLASAGAAIAFAALYAYAILHVHNPYLRGLCAVWFGTFAGVATGGALTTAKVRNNYFAGVAGVAAGLFGLYASWAVWLHDVLAGLGANVRAVHMAAAPASLFDMASLVNAIGTWSMVPGVRARGPELWLAWALEAIAILGAAAVASVFMTNRRPFCESCRAWSRSAQTLYFAPVMNSEELKKTLETDFATLYTIPSANADDEHLRLQLHVCDTCGNFNTLSVMERVKKGPVYDLKPVLARLVLGPDEAQHIYNLADPESEELIEETRQPIAV